MCRILYIEDDVDQRKLYANLLRIHDDIEVVAIGNTEADQLDWRGFDLVLVDIMMQGLSGDELVRRQVRRFRNYSLPPIVLFSAIIKSELDRIAMQLRRDTGVILIYSLSKAASLFSAIEAIRRYASVKATPYSTKY